MLLASLKWAMAIKKPATGYLRWTLHNIFVLPRYDYTTKLGSESSSNLLNLDKLFFASFTVLNTDNVYAKLVKVANIRRQLFRGI